MLNIFEVCRHNRVVHLLYASNSSGCGQPPIGRFHRKATLIIHCLSMYDAKRLYELMAHAYAHPARGGLDLDRAAVFHGLRAMRVAGHGTDIVQA